MKKVMILFVVMIVILGLSTAASAATLSDVVTALNNAEVPAVYVSQAEAYFNANPITSAQADSLIAHINAAAKIANGETSMTKLTGTQVSEILDEVSGAAKVVGLTAAYSGDETVGIFDSTGKLVFAIAKTSTPATSAIKQTGFDYSMVLAGLAMMLLAGSISIVTLLQKKIVLTSAV